MDVHASTNTVLSGMQLVNRRTGEYTGPCPHCQAGRDRYHVWTEPGEDGRPAWRYWCRACGASGVLDALQHDHATHHAPQRPRISPPPPTLPRPEHIAFYRQLYELTALWAHGWLIDDANPQPLAALAQRRLPRWHNEV